MRNRIPLEEAQKQLNELVRAAERGRSFIITHDGKPIARLLPIDNLRVLTPEQQAARERTRERMRRGFDLGGGKFIRDELYDRS